MKIVRAEVETKTLGKQAEPAMQRAANRAREVARQTNTTLVIYREGKIVEVHPDELDKLDEQKG